MDDFLTIYRKEYFWPATGRRLVRGPRPPPDVGETHWAIEAWEKEMGLCSAAWTGTDEANIGAEWLEAVKARKPQKKPCTLQQMDRIGMAQLRALNLQKRQLEREIVATDSEAKKNRRIYTSTYQRDYTPPGVPQVDALWSFSDLITMSRGLACEQMYDWPEPLKDRGGDRCQWGERTEVRPPKAIRRRRERPIPTVPKGRCC